MLLAASSLFAQIPCSPKVEFTVQAIDESADGAGDAKLVLSGVPANTFYVGYQAGASFTGSLGAGDAYSTKTVATETNTLGRYIATGLTNPASSAGEQYTVRVQDPVNNCFTDSTVVLPRVNWSVAPPYTDLEVNVSKSGDPSTVGDVITVTVEVYNNNTNPGVTAVDATGVQIVIHNPATGMTYVPGSDNTANGSYDEGTLTWNVGTVPAGASYTLTLQYEATSRGVFQVGAEVDIVTNTEEELDSVPLDEGGSVAFEDEDDEGSICIGTPWDWCATDQFTFQLISGAYNNITWFRNGSIIDSTEVTLYEVHSSGYLIIKSIGTYNFVYNMGGGACEATGCCPINVVEGLRPSLAAISPQAICAGDAMPTVTAVDNTAPTAYDDDRGPAEYQWFNNNGLSNPTTDSLTGYTSLSFDMSLLPATAGTYLYRLIARDSRHITCLDTTDFQFIVTDIEKPIAASNSPICEEDEIRLSIENYNEFSSGFAFNWYNEFDSTRTGTDSVTTFADAEPSWSDNYIVRVSQTFINPGFPSTYCEKLDTVNVVVNPLPVPPTVRDSTYCQYAEVATFLEHVTDSTGTTWVNVPPNVGYLNWYLSTNPADTLSSTNAVRSNDPAVSVNKVDSSLATTFGTYYVTAVDENGCESHTAGFDITIHPLPEPPGVADLAYCEGDGSVPPLTATPTAVTGFTLNWYGAGTRGDTLGLLSPTAPTPSAAVVDTLYFYVTQTEESTGLGCESFNSEITVFIKDTPDRPAFVDPVYCLNESAAALTSHLTQSPASTTSPVDTYIHWQYPDPSFTDDGVAVPTVSTADAGSNFGLVWEAWDYLRPDATTLTCTGEQEDFRVVVNPLPEVDLIAVNALCIGDDEQANGAIYVSDYRDSDTIDWQVAAAFDPGNAFTTVSGTTAQSQGGAFALNLSNPTGTPLTYAVRITNEFLCSATDTVDMNPKDCVCPGGYCEPATVQRVL